MQDEKTVGANQEPEQPSPQLTQPHGLSTSSGQFTAIFGVAAIILSLLGFHYSPAQIENWVQLVENFLTTIGPLLALVPVLMTFINSRGKIASNTVNANAQLLSQPKLISGELLPLVSSGGVIPAPLFSNPMSPDWRDPHTYENLLKIGVAIGVPGADKADKLNQQIHPADLIEGIWELFHHKAK